MRRSQNSDLHVALFHAVREADEFGRFVRITRKRRIQSYEFYGVENHAQAAQTCAVRSFGIRSGGNGAGLIE